MDINIIKKTIEKKIEKRRLQNHERWLKARQDFGNIVEMVKAKYNPERIYYWGSLLNESKFNSMSDIDIGIEGITDAEKFFALLGDVVSMTDFSVDIVQMEKIDPVYSALIRRKGVIIYERKE